MAEPSSYRIRNTLTIKDRKAVLQQFAEGRSVRSLADEYGCCRKQIRRIIARRDEIERDFVRDYANEERMQVTKELQRQLKIKFLDQVMLEFVQRIVHQNRPLNTQLLLATVHRVKEAIAVPNFRTTSDWLTQFCKRHQILVLPDNALRAQFHINAPKEQSLNHMELIKFVGRRNQRDKSDEAVAASLQRNKTTIIVQVEDTRESNVTEISINSQEEARKHLRALQEYAMMQENFRAIGLLMQAENVLAYPPNQADFELA